MEYTEESINNFSSIKKGDLCLKLAYVDTDSLYFHSNPEIYNLSQYFYLLQKKQIFEEDEKYVGLSDLFEGTLFTKDRVRSSKPFPVTSSKRKVKDRKSSKYVKELNRSKAEQEILKWEKQKLVQRLNTAEYTMNLLDGRIAELERKNTKLSENLLATESNLNVATKERDGLQSILSELLNQLPRNKNKSKVYTCIICYENSCDAVFPECGHAMFCLICTNKLTSCPLCRSSSRNNRAKKMYLQ